MIQIFNTSHHFILAEDDRWVDTLFAGENLNLPIPPQSKSASTNCQLSATLAIHHVTTAATATTSTALRQSVIEINISRPIKCKLLLLPCE
jgi:hypothetical protein